uniref:Uncharacterized protein n=1 Tax=Anopheles dirus TaxID=7168 RepID=A0A182NX84_9DIPT
MGSRIALLETHKR